MVFFTCNNCGESLKKASVLKHYGGQCRKPVSLTCIDCCKDFDAATFNGHTKCLTEDEKYSAKGFVPKTPSNKQEIKQQQWIKLINSLAHSDKVSSKDELSLLHYLSQCNNVPRKKPKFQNFIANSGGRRYQSSTIQSVWELLHNENTESSKQENGHNSSDNADVTESKNEPDTGNISLQSVNSPKKDKSVNNINNLENVSTGEKGNDSEKQLSKKQRKALKKKLKYESELKGIENQDPTILTEQNDKSGEKREKKRKKMISEGDSEAETSVVDHESKTTNKKQLKKAKRAKLASMSEQDGGQNRKEPDVMAEENVFDVKEKKKKKGKCTDTENLVGNDIEKNNDNTLEGDAQPEKTQFDWEAVIVEALSAKKDKQLSIKKLKKKVIAEYIARKNGDYIPDNITSKFKKKIHKIPGVKIIKDIAILKTAE